jgi:UDP-N-acetylglucosamine:LPS N-acetylglucosamine transferase
VGGHLTELLCLRSAYERHPHFYIFNDVTQFAPPPGIPVYTIAHAERDPRVVSNIWEVARIFRKERPTVLLTTGAGPGVSAAVAARLMGLRVVFVETVAAVQRPSLTGVLMEPLADAYFVQWPELAGKNAERWQGNIFGCS